MVFGWDADRGQASLWISWIGSRWLFSVTHVQEHVSADIGASIANAVSRVTGLQELSLFSAYNTASHMLFSGGGNTCLKNIWKVEKGRVWIWVGVGGGEDLGGLGVGETIIRTYAWKDSIFNKNYKNIVICTIANTMKPLPCLLYLLVSFPVDHAIEVCMCLSFLRT